MEQTNNIINALVEKDGIDKVDLASVDEISPEILNLIPEEIATRYKMLPFAKEADVLCVAMANPFDIFAQDLVRSKIDLRPRFFFTPEEELNKWISKLYLEQKNIMPQFDEQAEVGVEVQDADHEEELSIEALKDRARDAPAIQYVNYILLKAIQERASDIHIEPRERTMKVRLRIDGVLRELTSPPKRLQSGIISRIKILGAMDIAERRVPQDGRSKIRILGRSIDLRISTLPTIYGEKVVMRILDKGAHSLDVNDIGFEPGLLERFKQAINEPHGMILVTGPTGSGKTTTLYSALNYVNTPEKNIITVEDPVEYRLEGINQVQAKPQIGLTFAAGLRSILRQDPDIIMVGEIRDRDTADIAVKAALTGHLVFSTLHTNTSVATIMRLIDMGVDKFLICSSVLLVLAQRLVRRICLHCSEPHQIDSETLQRLKIDPAVFEGAEPHKGAGCNHCGGSGYLGRAAVYEFLLLNNRLREMIMKDASMDELVRAAKELGMDTLWDNGLKKVARGITTIEEVLRVASNTGDGF